MEGTKYLIILLLITTGSGAQTSYKYDIYNAYINNNMTEWGRIIDKMESSSHKTSDLILELVNYQYGYIGWCLGIKNQNGAKKYLSLAETNLKKLEISNYKLSMVNSYKSAFYGFRISLNTYKAPFYGPKSLQYAKTAIQLDAGNPYGYIQLGNIEFFMPAIFGGSKERAIEYYRIAQKLMEDKGEIVNDWNYLNLLVVIAQAYRDIDNISMAREYYEKILEIEPDFLWVKKVLYPEVLRNY